MRSRMVRYGFAIMLVAICSCSSGSGTASERAASASEVPSAGAVVEEVEVEIERVPVPLVVDERWICSDSDVEIDLVDCLSRRLRAVIGALDAQAATLVRSGGLNSQQENDAFEREYGLLRSTELCRRAASETAHIRCSTEQLEALQVTLSWLSWLDAPTLPALPHQMWGLALSEFNAECEVRVRVAAEEVDWVQIAKRGFATPEDGQVGAARVEISGAAGLGPVRGTSSSSWETGAGETVAMDIVIAGTHYHDSRHDVMAGVWFGKVGVDSQQSDIYGYWWINFDDGVRGVGEIRNLEAGTFGEVLTAEIVQCD